jgi:hypothetical protein
LALAVGGSIPNSRVFVIGRLWVGTGGQVPELNASCASRTTVDQPFPFATIKQSVSALSQYLAGRTIDVCFCSGKLCYNLTNSDQ